MEENTSENNADETPAETAEQEPVHAPETTEAAAASPPTVRLRDRVWSFRSILAVAIASLLLGGAGGAGIVAATDGHGHRDRFSRFAFGPDGRGGMRFHRPGGGYGFNGGGPGGFYPPVMPQQNGQTGPTTPAPPSASGG